jgi:hypothetical protein
LKDKVKNKVIPFANKALDFANSDFAQGVMGLAGTGLNLLAPGAGTALQGGLKSVINLGNNVRDIGNKVGNIASEARNTWNNEDKQQLPRIKRGINLARKPGEMNSRIQLKALPPADEEVPTTKYSLGLLPRGPRIEELD